MRMKTIPAQGSTEERTAGHSLPAPRPISHQRQCQPAQCVRTRLVTAIALLDEGARLPKLPECATQENPSKQRCEQTWVMLEAASHIPWTQA